MPSSIPRVAAARAVLDAGGSHRHHDRYRSLVTNEQLVFVVPIITASISFVAAVVAVVIGQLLGQRFTRRADERRWKREDTARRRLRGEEATLEARKALRKASSLFEAGWDAAGYQPGRWEQPPDEAVGKLTEHAQDVAIDIPEMMSSSSFGTPRTPSTARM